MIDDAWRWRADLIATLPLLWIASRGGLHEPPPAVHLYLYDRYFRLAEHHWRRGHQRKAARLHRKAEAHYRRSGHRGPPFAAALAMPVPRPPMLTWAVATKSIRPPDDAA